MTVQCHGLCLDISDVVDDTVAPSCSNVYDTLPIFDYDAVLGNGYCNADGENCDNV